MAWLAQCYCDVSEDSVKGYSQKRGAFWKQVKDKFNNNDSGWERAEDSLSSKWTHLNRACTEFMPIYKEAKDNWQSGASDDDMYLSALDSYERRYKKMFNMKDAFLFLKDHPKWNAPVDPFAGTTQADSPNMGDSFAFSLSQNDDELQNELFQAMRLSRPPGRDRSKKARSSASSDAGGSSRSSASKVDELMDTLNKYTQEMETSKNNAMDNFNEFLAMQAAVSGFNLFTADTSSMPNQEDREMFEGVKNKLRGQIKDYLKK